MSILEQRVKDVKKTLLKDQADDDTTVPDFQALLEEERAGKNRKILIAWLEEQDAHALPPEASEPTDVSVLEVESVYTGVDPAVAGADVSVPVKPVVAAGIDSIEGGVIPIGELISILCQKRDSWQRSTSCGVENIKVHLSDITISVS